MVKNPVQSTKSEIGHFANRVLNISRSIDNKKFEFGIGKTVDIKQTRFPTLHNISLKTPENLPKRHEKNIFAKDRCFRAQFFLLP